MIPSGAVEAAADAISKLPAASVRWEWERREVARAALEAAAPHMLAEVVSPTFDDREELADVFTGHTIGFGGYPKKLMRGHAQEIADAILGAGYRKVTQ